MSQSGCVTFEYLWYLKFVVSSPCDEEGDPLRGFELSFLPGPEWPGAAMTFYPSSGRPGGILYPTLSAFERGVSTQLALGRID